MKKNWKLTFALFLIGASVALHFLHYLIFRDPHHIFIYLLGDIAFVPVSVLFVTLILEQMLERKQKETTMHKLNMVLGAFFSEVGGPLIKLLDVYNRQNPDLMQHLDIRQDWGNKDFAQAKAFLKSFSASMDSRIIDLNKLCEFLSEKRSFLLGLLENPNLLEHEKMTDMLWAIFHLTEELQARKNLRALEQNDSEHISVDIKRAYGQLISEWLEYMKHLKTDYPYLYSLAVRINPFNPIAKAEVS